MYQFEGGHRLLSSCPHYGASATYGCPFHLNMSESLVVLGAALLLSFLLWWLRRPSGMPPGPPRSFWGDNTPDIPRSKPWETFTAWNKKYGELKNPRRCINRALRLTVSPLQDLSFRSTWGANRSLVCRIVCHTLESEIFTFFIGLVLGTAQAAWDLLDKRADIYSGRPRSIVA